MHVNERFCTYTHKYSIYRFFFRFAGRLRRVTVTYTHNLENASVVDVINNIYFSHAYVIVIYFNSGIEFECILNKDPHVVLAEIKSLITNTHPIRDKFQTINEDKTLPRD